MNRKPGFPSSTCFIKLPDGVDKSNNAAPVASDNYKIRQQLIMFGHEQWGFKNWSWSVTKQDLDFVDLANGKYSAGVVAFVSIKIKSLDIFREDMGYATSVATQKGSAIHNARKSSITNALRETLLSFGGNIASSLMEQLETYRTENCEEISKIADSVNDSRTIERIASGSKNTAEIKANYPIDASHQQNRGPRKDSGDSSEVHQNKSDIKSPLRLQNRNETPVEAGQYSVGQLKLQANSCHSNPPENSKVINVGESATVAPQHVSRPLQLTNISPQRPNVYPLAGNTADFQGTEEELRAERKRRQKQKQEEFKLKQMQKSNLNLPLVPDVNPKAKIEAIVLFATQDSDENADTHRHSDENMQTAVTAVKDDFEEKPLPQFFSTTSKRTNRDDTVISKKVCGVKSRLKLL